jgi:hypothetical protein
MMEHHTLEQAENVIDGCIREHNPAMIYWHHKEYKWFYFLSSDVTLIEQEMQILIMQIKSGTIVNVSKGLVVDVKGTQLYPVEVEFKNTQCADYFLLAKKGLTHHLYMTPYFFRSEMKRDEIFDFLINHGK